MKRSFLFFALVLNFCSCQKKIHSSGNYEELVGTWKWVYTTNDYGDTSFSSSINEKREIIVNKNGIINIYVNNRKVYRLKIKEIYNKIQESGTSEFKFNYTLSVTIPFNSTTMNFKSKKNKYVTNIISPLLKPNYHDYYKKE